VEPQIQSHRRVVGPLVSLVKKLARRAVRWYVQPQLDEQQDRIIRLEQQQAYLKRMMCTRPHIDPEFVRGQANPAIGESFDYVGFERKFRGPSGLIRDLLRCYVPFFRDRKTIFDLGCGRGEFLDVLREAGITTAAGVESHAGQAEECCRKGHVVHVANIGDYLHSVPDESVDGLFSAHVIEHIPFAELTKLFHVFRRKLRPGGVMIAETVNPHCLAAFKLFYLDPTHIAPLFPEVVHFLGESVGFSKCSIIHPDRGQCLEPDRIWHESGEYALVAER
jgi:2-polyprenyl-3-methyl-5-hydroxy-6-metoxy-1,4-benzoquinol methylase